jgi:hypothetical protein
MSSRDLEFVRASNHKSNQPKEEEHEQEQEEERVSKINQRATKQRGLTRCPDLSYQMPRKFRLAQQSYISQAIDFFLVP